ncbi:hypothetical protein VdG1_05765 [Verticillium dahliae VDG1]|nr:hypothetical protein VdG1_05765 [Verticillium dahliae VDG1]
MATAANDVELHRAPEPEGGALQTAKDLFSGAAGGITQVLVGQPFDIVKVRLQTSTAHTSALEAATAIYRNEGPLAFYKGTLTPLVGIGACTDGFGPAQRYATMRDCFAQTYRAEGLRGFWKGIAPTLLRAMPVSAATFATVELTMRLIN